MNYTNLHLPATSRHVIRRNKSTCRCPNDPFTVFGILIGGVILYIGFFCVLFLNIRIPKERVSLFEQNIDRRNQSIFLIKPSAYNTWFKTQERSCMKNSTNENENNLIVVVKSAVGYAKRRELIRRTWGSLCVVNGWKLKTVFIMGNPLNIAQRRLIDEERVRYEDLLLYDGPDDYKNMPSKVLAGMEWARDNLPDDVWIGSADDDFLVDMTRFTKLYDTIITNTTEERKKFIVDKLQYSAKQHLSECPEDFPFCLEKMQNRTNLKNDPMICLFRLGQLEEVNRQQGSKWFVSRSKYSHDVYPRYCHGGFYMMPLQLSNELLAASYNAPMLRLDDVWITGILRLRAGIPDYLVQGIDFLAEHYGPRVKKENMIPLMQHDWMSIYGNMTSQSSNRICKCSL